MSSHNAYGNVLLRGNARLTQVAATNGFSGFFSSEDEQGNKPLEAVVGVIPSPHATALATLLRSLDADAEVTLSICNDARSLHVAGDAVSWWSALVDANFPDISMSIPDNEAKADMCHIVVDRDLLMTALRRSNIFRGEGSYITLSGGGNSLRVGSPETEIGSSYEMVNAMMEGETVCRMDAKMLINSVQAFECDEIEMWLPVDSSFTSVITIQAAEDPSVVAMIAPSSR